MSDQIKLSTRLKKARAIIADPKRWTQGTLGRKDRRVEGGIRVCALGACYLVSGGDPIKGDVLAPSGYRQMRSALTSCTTKLFKRASVVSLNDDASSRKKAHANVLAAFDCAIAEATAAEKAAAAE